MKTKQLKFKLFNTLYEMTLSVKITKRVPKFVTVKSTTNWIYKGQRFKVNGVKYEVSKFAPEYGRTLEISLIGTEFEKSKGYKYTFIPESDLILEY